MNYLKLKDFNLRLSLAKKENSLLVNKFLFVNLLNSNKILSPKIIKYFLSLKKKNIFGTRIVNRCVITIVTNRLVVRPKYPKNFSRFITYWYYTRS